MASNKWFYAPQNDFKNWVTKNNLSKSCLSQKIGLNQLVEEYEVWPVSGGAPSYVKFTAARLTSQYYTATIEVDGKTISLNQQ